MTGQESRRELEGDTRSEALHLGDLEPTQGDRTGIAAHMASLLCPVCGEKFVAGSHVGGELMFSLHWRTKQAEEERDRELHGIPLFGMLSDQQMLDALNKANDEVASIGWADARAARAGFAIQRCIETLAHRITIAELMK